jgi:hypothetical protein
MPTIQESLSSKIDMTGYSSVEVSKPAVPSAFTTSQSVQRDAFLRCPVPAISSTATSDGLRQFYKNNQIPQYRVAF